MAIIKKNPQRINAGESVEIREPSYSVGGNANWHSHYGEQYGGFSKNLKIQPPYDFAVPSLGIFLKKIMVQKDICTPEFVSMMFTIAKIWKPPKCPSIEEWRKKIWCIYIQWNITQPLKRKK